MRCPFAPWCDASLLVIVPDGALTVRYPVHAIETDNPAVTGMQCPGSGTLMLRSGHAHTSESARLADQLNAYAVAEAAERRADAADAARESGEFDDFAERAARLIEDRHRRRVWREPGLPIMRDEHDVRDQLDDARTRRLDEVPDNVVPLRREPPDDAYPTPSEVEDFEHGGLNLGAGPDRPAEEFFPGRPADAPEPGPGEPPAATVAWDAPVTIIPMGHTAVDNLRGQLIELVLQCIDQIGQSQDALAKLTSQLDAAQSYTAVIEQEITAAEALLSVAVGTSGDQADAAEVRSCLHVAKDTVTGSSDSILTALAVAHDRSDLIMTQLALAVEAAERYRNVP